MPSIDSINTNMKELSLDFNTHLDKALSQAFSSVDDQRIIAAQKVADLLLTTKVTDLSIITDKLRSGLSNKDSKIRENASYIVETLAVSKNLGRLQAYLHPIMKNLLDGYADKAINVRNASEKASKALLTSIDVNSVKYYLPLLFNALDRTKKWQTKKASLELIIDLCKYAPIQISRCLPEIIPIVSDIMWDTKPEVKKTAHTCMEKVCSVVGNGDIEPFIPALISSIADPSEVPECVYKLSATTFVKTVEAPALAIMEPLLSRGLKENKTAIKRQTAVIIDNMCKLLEDPAEAQLFMPKLLPGLKKVSETTADPECRSVAENAYKTLYRAGGEVEITEDDVKVEFKSINNTLCKVLDKFSLSKQIDNLSKEYVAGIALYLVSERRYNEKIWKEFIEKYFGVFIKKENLNTIAKEFLSQCQLDNKIKGNIQDNNDDVEDGEDLCDCEFSLAYGGMILLNNARLNLKRGKRYALCGPNGAGKSTLMRSIANGQLEGFPDKSQLKTVYVEHVLQAEEAEMKVVDFIHSDKELCNRPRNDIVDALSKIGFTDVMQNMAVASLSGGWKMKLELARAMLLNADVLLLDEPTNHLDVKNVAWLENYLLGLKDVTSMIVSHDSSFIDNVCTGIIHYENRKLRKYKGNLTEFVKIRPEAKAYYELQSASVVFKFPEPGYLADVKNKGKPIMRLNNCSYTYPGSSKPSINNITLSCSLASRIAVIGPNGAGKSTLIKMLTGEVEPQTGTVTKHPAMRFAYVAQHAFHHIEQHLDISANEYIQWRFQSGEDKELLAKDTRKLSPEEKALMKKPISWEGEKRVMEEIVSRRKYKKSYEYEIKWEKFGVTDNSWIPRERLEKWGFEKLLQIADDREAARANLQARPCTSGVIQKHLDDFGLTAEFGTHSRMRGLSGGQKVKVVLAAAMWQNPHILVLDEPTNYLDRDSLGALAQAIKEFGGGVVMISHHTEFTSALCQEIWNVENGYLKISGEVADDKTKIEVKTEEETVDAFGNVVKTKIKRKLTRKELKAKLKLKKEAEARGEYYSDSDLEDEI